jgi:hypothetical protein
MAGMKLTSTTRGGIQESCEKRINFQADVCSDGISNKLISSAHEPEPQGAISFLLLELQPVPQQNV